MDLIPDEILALIFDKLLIKEICPVLLVCERFKTVLYYSYFGSSEVFREVQKIKSECEIMNPLVESCNQSLITRTYEDVKYNTNILTYFVDLEMGYTAIKSNNLEIFDLYTHLYANADCYIIQAAKYGRLRLFEYFINLLYTTSNESISNPIEKSLIKAVKYNQIAIIKLVIEQSLFKISYRLYLILIERGAKHAVKYIISAMPILDIGRNIIMKIISRNDTDLLNALIIKHGYNSEFMKDLLYCVIYKSNKQITRFVIVKLLEINEIKFVENAINGPRIMALHRKKESRELLQLVIYLRKLTE